MAVTTIETLNVDIKGDGSDYLKEIDKVLAETKKLYDEWDKADEELRQHRREVFAEFRELIAEQISELGHKLVETWKEVAPHIDSVTKAARRLGTSTETLVELEHAGSLVGAAAGTVEMAVKTMNQRLADTAGQGKKAAAALESIGLSANQLANAPLKEQLGAIADGFHHARNHAEAAAAANRIFGRSGASLLPLLEQGSEKLHEWMHEAKELGITFTDGQGQMVEAAQRSIAEISDIIEGLKQQFVIGIAPVVQVIAQYIADWSKELLAAGDTGGPAGVFIDVLGVILDAAVKIKNALADSWDFAKNVGTVLAGDTVDRSNVGIESTDKYGIQTYRGEGESAKEWLNREIAEMKAKHANEVPGGTTPMERPKAIDDFSAQMEKQLRDLEIQFQGVNDGLTKTQISLRQAFDAKVTELTRQGESFTAEEKEKLDILYEEISAVDALILAREEEKKKAKEAIKEAEKAKHELERSQEKLAKEAHKILEDSLSPIEELKFHLEEIEDLWRSGALSRDETDAAQDKLVAEFAEKAASVKATGGSAVRFGSVDDIQERSQKSVGETAEKGIWKLVEKQDLHLKTEQEILSEIKKGNAARPIAVAIP